MRVPTRDRKACCTLIPCASLSRAHSNCSNAAFTLGTSRSRFNAIKVGFSLLRKSSQKWPKVRRHLVAASRAACVRLRTEFDRAACRVRNCVRDLLALSKPCDRSTQGMGSPSHPRDLLERGCDRSRPNTMQKWVQFRWRNLDADQLRICSAVVARRLQHQSRCTVGRHRADSEQDQSPSADPAASQWVRCCSSMQRKPRDQRRARAAWAFLH